MLLKFLVKPPVPNILPYLDLAFLTKKQVLLCIIANLQKLDNDRLKHIKTKPLAYNAVAEEIEKHFKKAGVGVKSRRALLDSIQKLHIKYCSLKKSASRIRERPAFSKETAPFWHRNAETELKNKILCNKTSEEEKQTAKEDLLFYKSMLSDCIATYTTRDQKALIEPTER